MDYAQAASIYEGECPGCGMEFTKKRSNQVFCTSRCKNHHHNSKSRVGRLAFKERHEITKEVEDILWRNREVLLNSKKEVSLEDLKKRGFRTSYITHFVVEKPTKSQKRNIMYVYDIAYVFINSNTIKILNHGK